MTEKVSQRMKEQMLHFLKRAQVAAWPEGEICRTAFAEAAELGLAEGESAAERECGESLDEPTRAARQICPKG